MEEEFGPSDVRLAAALHNAGMWKQMPVFMTVVYGVIVAVCGSTASVYVATNDLERAASLLSRALAIKRNALGEEAIELVDTFWQLAEVNVKQVYTQKGVFVFE